MANSKKITAIIIVVVVLIIVGFAVSKKSAVAPTISPTVSATPIVTNIPVPSGLVLYQNNQYGFGMILPGDWNGFSIISDTWTGYVLPDSQMTETGPKIIIRHPGWTAGAPYEDLPVLVFTPDEWSQVLREQLSVSAAPIPPSILGQNTKYVFALPARYNYDYRTGWQELDSAIMDKNNFKTF
ncbi:MAG: hypothetical protein ABR875_03110 [Minisyncoccia bacterium]